MSAPRRLQRRRTSGYQMPQGAVYVGRPTNYGNRYKAGEEIEHVDGTTVLVSDASHAVQLFREWLDWQFAHFSTWRPSLVSELGGKDLVCWCKPGAPCHADVLLEIANG